MEEITSYCCKNNQIAKEDRSWGEKQETCKSEISGQSGKSNFLPADSDFIKKRQSYWMFIFLFLSGIDLLAQIQNH